MNGKITRAASHDVGANACGDRGSGARVSGDFKRREEYSRDASTRRGDARGGRVERGLAVATHQEYDSDRERARHGDTNEGDLRGAGRASDNDISGFCARAAAETFCSRGFLGVAAAFTPAPSTR